MYDRQQMLRLVNRHSHLAQEYSRRVQELAPIKFNGNAVDQVLNEMFDEYASDYEREYKELVSIELPFPQWTPELQEVQRLLNVTGWKRLMYRFEKYAEYQQALQSHAGSNDQQSLWEKIGKEFRKLGRHNPST